MRIVKRFIQKCLGVFGLNLRRIPPKNPFQQKPSWGTSSTTDFLLRFAEGTDALIDIGANRGKFTEQYRKIAHKNSCYLIEPIPVLFDYLKDKFDSPLVSIYKVAVSDVDNLDGLFYVAENDGQSSSLLKMAQRHLDVSPDSRQLETLNVNISTLDNLLKEVTFERAFLKIDVQGHELAVLKGSIQKLKNVTAIHTEVSFTRLYENDVAATKVIDFLIDQGFIVYGIDPWFTDNSANGELLQADVFFVRPQLLKKNS